MISSNFWRWVGQKWKWFRELATFISVSNKSSKTIIIIQFLENSPVSWSWKVSTYQLLCKIVYFMGIILKSKLLIGEFWVFGKLWQSNWFEETDRTCPSTTFTSLIHTYLHELFAYLFQQKKPMVFGKRKKFHVCKL